MRVDPDPPNGSNTMSPGRLLLVMARSISSTGFIVGCKSLRRGLSKHHTSPWSLAPDQCRSEPCLPAVEQRLILALVIRPSQCESIFGPDHKRGPVPAGSGKPGVEG